jgi:hypothetical protein
MRIASEKVRDPLALERAIQRGVLLLLTGELPTEGSSGGAPLRAAADYLARCRESKARLASRAGVAA